MRQWIEILPHSIAISNARANRAINSPNFPPRRLGEKVIPLKAFARVDKREFRWAFEDLTLDIPITTFEALLMETAFINRGMHLQAVNRKRLWNSKRIVTQQQALLQQGEERLSKIKNFGKDVFEDADLEQQGNTWMEKAILAGTNLANIVHSEDPNKTDVMRELNAVVFARPENLSQEDEVFLNLIAARFNTH